MIARYLLVFWVVTPLCVQLQNMLAVTYYVVQRLCHSASSTKHQTVYEKTVPLSYCSKCMRHALLEACLFEVF